MKIELTVNGRKRSIETHPLARLLDLIRDGLDLKGCKEGCGEGECGACSVIMNGRLVNACMVPAIQASGAELITIEGLSGPGGPDGQGGLDALQQAFVDAGAVQCGFCTPGMVLAARALLELNKAPSELETRTALSGNLCRCTGYARICAAVDQAVQNGYSPEPCGPGRRMDRDCLPEFSAEERENFFSPLNLEEALRILAERPDLTLLAGGTDIGPDMKSGKLRPSGAMDIFSLPELKRVRRKDGWVHIGSCVTDTEMMEDELISGHFQALREAASGSAAPAIRNRATIGGNLCTASGAADLPVALMALGAWVCVRDLNGERLMPVHEFVRNYRDPDLRPGEILVDIRVPIPPQGATQKFFKRGSRAALTLSRVSLGLYLELAQGRITECRAAAGSMSPVPIRLFGLEDFLRGRKLDEETISASVLQVQEELNPRKSPRFRKTISANLLRRFLESAQSAAA